jgi:glycosyltransferase involved in cell wall biosynthesis
MNTIPEVSVVIPTYRRTVEVVTAINSVLQQSFQDFEIIIVDDASPEDIEHVVTGQIQDERLRFIRLEQNRGAAGARNAGIRAARGRYIAFLDSDDTWLPEKLELQLAELKQAPENILVACTGSYLEMEGRTQVVIPQITQNWYKRSLKHFDLGIGSVFLGERSVFDRVGYLDEDLRRFEDPEWMIRYTRNYDLLIVPQPLCVVNRTTSGNPELHEQCLDLLLQKRGADLDSFGRLYGNMIRAKRWRELAAYYYFTGNVSRARELFLKAFSISFIPQPPWGDYLVFWDVLTGMHLFKFVRDWKRKLVG